MNYKPDGVLCSVHLHYEDFRLRHPPLLSLPVMHLQLFTNEIERPPTVLAVHSDHGRIVPAA